MEPVYLEFQRTLSKRRDSTILKYRTERFITPIRAYRSARHSASSVVDWRFFSNFICTCICGERSRLGTVVPRSVGAGGGW